MKTALRLISAIALTLLLAQQPAQAEGTAQATAPAPAAAAASGDKPTMTTKDYETWRMECLTFKNGKKICQLFQRQIAEDKEKKKHIVLAVKVAVIPEKDKEGKIHSVTRMMIISPLGTLLPAKMAIKLDGEKEIKVDYLTCAPEGCMVDLGLEGPLLEKIKTGKKLRITYKRMMSDKAINLEIPLAGFAAGLKALADQQGG